MWEISSSALRFAKMFDHDKETETDFKQDEKYVLTLSNLVSVSTTPSPQI